MLICQNSYCRLTIKQLIMSIPTMSIFLFDSSEASHIIRLKQKKQQAKESTINKKKKECACLRDKERLTSLTSRMASWNMGRTSRFPSLSIILAWQIQYLANFCAIGTRDSTSLTFSTGKPCQINTQRALDQFSICLWALKGKHHLIRLIFIKNVPRIEECNATCTA